MQQQYPQVVSPILWLHEKIIFFDGATRLIYRRCISLERYSASLHLMYQRVFPHSFVTFLHSTFFLDFTTHFDKTHERIISTRIFLTFIWLYTVVIYNSTDSISVGTMSLIGYGFQQELHRCPRIIGFLFVASLFIMLKLESKMHIGEKKWKEKRMILKCNICYYGPRYDGMFYSGSENGKSATTIGIV